MLEDVNHDVSRGEGAPASEKKPKTLREKREAVKAKRESSVIRALRVEIAKPLENPDTWDELGAELRRQRAICGRLLRAAFLAYVHAVKYPDQHKDRDGEKIPASTVAYQEVQREIVSKRAWAKKLLLKQSSKDDVKLLSELPVDLDAIDQVDLDDEDDDDKKFRALDTAEGQAKLQHVLENLTGKSKDDSSDDADDADDAEGDQGKSQGVRRLLTWVLFRMPGGTKSAISNTAVLKASEWLKKSGDTAIPSFKNGSPLPIRKQEFRIIEEPEEREVKGKTKKTTRICLELKLRAGRTGRVKILIRPTKGTHWQALRRIISGKEEKGHAAGALKLVYDESSRRMDGKKGKWFAIISYSTPIPVMPTECDPDKVLVVHRGLYSLLTVASSAATNWKTVDSGHKYTAFKRRILARQKQIRAVPKGERGTGSRGHGRKRRYQTYDYLDSKIDDFRKTYIQQAWSRVIHLAKIWGCGTICIEDYSSIAVEEPRFQIQFPWAELKTWGEYVCKREGLQFTETSSAYISQCCPLCGHTEDSGRQVVRRRGVFHCQRCNFERPLDMVSTIHMLRRAAPKVNAWDVALEKEFRNAKALGQVKEEIAGKESKKPKKGS